MEKEHRFFETNLSPLVQELEAASRVLNDVCEEMGEGMCFLLKGTLDRIAKEIKRNAAAWEKDFEVYRKAGDE